jgi:hypothetical protein
MTWWTKEGLVAVRPATIGVRPGITFASVRFDLSNTDGNRRPSIRALEYAAEQGWRDLEDVTSKEIATRKAQFVKVVHRAIVPVKQEHSVQLEVVHYF